MKFHIESIAARRENQDRVAVIEAGECIVIALADGAGGTGGGADAARAAVEHCRREALAGRLLTAADCAAVVRAADDVVAEFGGETTLVLVVVANERLYGASVGDSIAWIIDASGDILDLTEQQRRKPLLGSGESAAVGFGPVDARGTLLVASDGVYKYLPYVELARALRELSPEDCARDVIERVIALHRTPPDDMTIVVCRMDA